MARPPAYRSTITLIPGGCIQYLDFSFDITAVAKLVRSFHEEERGVDAKSGEMKYDLHCLVFDEETRTFFDRSSHKPFDRQYDINAARALEPFLDQWVPLPFLRRTGQTTEGEPTFANGPSNWCRGYVSALPSVDEDGHTHRLTIAFDTVVEPPSPGEYGALATADIESGEEFLFASHERDFAWFLNEGWVDQWLYECFYEMKLAARKGRPLREEDFPVACEHLARYITYVNLIAQAVVLPRLRLIDPARSAPVDVDLIVDIGNARTCGIIIESLPDTPTNLNDSYALELRDLSRPTETYREPFSSQIEFCRPEFGRPQLSKRSSRRTEAFAWPAAVRIGPEAQRLSTRAMGTEGPTGMSSPKRYLWDERTRLQEWRYNGMSADGRVTEPPVTSGLFVQFLNEAGTPIGKLKDPAIRGNPIYKSQSPDPAFHARYSRSSLMMFALGEIIAQALVAVNSPGRRSVRPQSDIPRRLRRIILTMPTAMPLAELKIFRRWANWAVYVTWQALGWGEFYGDANDPRRQARRGDYRLSPDVRADFDEASATQLVYLYDEITRKYQGDVRYFFKLMGKRRGVAGGSAPESLRVASIDIGGGTTDLMITSYEALGSGATAAIRPTQNFREGFKIAGDDILAALIERHVLRPILQALQRAGVDDAKSLMTQLFGENFGEQPEAARALRRRFANEIARPIGLSFLAMLEDADPLGADLVTQRRFGEFFPMPPNQQIVDYLESAAARAGARDFKLGDVSFDIRLSAFDETVKRTIGQIVIDLAEVIYLYDCDVVLLSGRPSRLPALTSLMLAKLPVPPDRILPMHKFRIGSWYPFRGPKGTIEDPKTTAALGAVLCALSEGQLQNFALQASKFHLRSTARFIGELELSGQIKASKVFFADLNVDAKDDVEKNHVLEFFAPVFIGFRQLAAERWTATPFYRLCFRDQVAIANARNRLPYKVELAYFVKAPDETRVGSAGSEVDEGEFRIGSIEDTEGYPVSPGDMELRLQTLRTDEGYWTDTGTFNVI